MNRLIAILFILSLTLASLAQSNNESPKPVTQEQATESQIINNKCFSLTMDNIIDILNIVVTALLGLMAYRASNVINKLTKRQIKNEELLNMPVFEIKTSSFTHHNNFQNDCSYNSDKTTITNIGGNLFDFKSEIHTFLKITDVGKSQTYKVSGFMDQGTDGNLHKGLLETKYTLDSMGYFNDIYFDVVNYNITNTKSAKARLERFIIIQYKDFKQHQHKDIFKQIGFNWTQVEKIDYDSTKEYSISDLAKKDLDKLINGDI